MLPWLSLSGSIGGGYSYCLMDTDAGPVSTGIPVINISAGPSFNILPYLSLNINVSYEGFLGLTNSIGIAAGVTYKIENKPDNQGPPVLQGLPPKLLNLEFDTIFPVFYKYYDDHPVGSGLLLNPREDEITDISLDFFVKQYMDTPKKCNVPDSLGPGETGNIDISALFNNTVLQITEGTKVAAELTLSYRVDGREYSDVSSETIRMQYRNAMTWDDDRRAAAFVTAKDPAIMSFAKNVASMLHGRDSSAINKNLQKGMAIHNALLLHGLTYVIDPNTSYVELSSSKTAVDYLQFPRETLEYKAGDCDDLSILYSALFEALGIESAFVTVPGHIYAAFSLDINEDEALKTFQNSDNLIFIEEKAWIPLEITALNETFLEAWEIGAKEWRENVSKNQTGFFPVRSSWQYYEPVGLPGSEIKIELPLPRDVVQAFRSELDLFISRELQPQVEKLKKDIERTKGAVRYINRLGVLYARYGYNDKASSEFSKAIETKEYFPSLINLGNLSFMEKKMQNALGYYNRGFDIKPDNSNIILSIARTYHSLEDYESTTEYFNKLIKIDPDLASRFLYLDLQKDESTRAANIENSEKVVFWEDEDE
jgi:tetratricopeptide (TPR) repeat protein